MSSISQAAEKKSPLFSPEKIWFLYTQLSNTWERRLGWHTCSPCSGQREDMSLAERPPLLCKVAEISYSYQSHI